MSKGAEGLRADRLADVRAQLEDLCRIRLVAQLLPDERRRYQQLCAEERELLALDDPVSTDFENAATASLIDLTDPPAYTRAHRVVRPLLSGRRAGRQPC